MTEMTSRWIDLFFKRNSVRKIKNSAPKSLSQSEWTCLDFHQCWPIKDRRWALVFRLLFQIALNSRTRWRKQLSWKSRHKSDRHKYLINPSTFHTTRKSLRIFWTCLSTTWSGTGPCGLEAHRPPMSIQLNNMNSKCWHGSCCRTRDQHCSCIVCHRLRCNRWRFCSSNARKWNSSTRTYRNRLCNIGSKAWDSISACIGLCSPSVSGHTCQRVFDS